MARRRVIVAAAVIWLCGGVVLLFKGGSLLWEAFEIRPNEIWNWLVLPAGLLLGGIKTELIFKRTCQKNLDRIEAIEKPRIWQAYRPRFYLFLAAMILVGVTLSGLAQGNYAGLLAVAILDLGLATALLASSRQFRARL